jgi:hypothetical protein
MAAESTFDPCIVVGGVDQCIGSFVHVRVMQAVGAPAGEYNNLVINPTLPFDVQLEWQLDGTMAGAGCVPMILAGIAATSWRVYIYAEKMGPGTDLLIYDSNTLAAADRPAVGPAPTAVPVRWQHTANIPAATLPEAAPPGTESGVYKLVTTVWANSAPPAGTPDIVGFHEGPMIMSENPV